MSKEKTSKPELALTTLIQYIKGVGPKLAELFNRRYIFSVEDLLRYYPRIYEDRRSNRLISELEPNQLVSLRVSIKSTHSMMLGRSGRKLYEVVLADKSGQISCKFFRVPYKGYFERFKPHTVIQVIGKPIIYRGRLEFHHPELKDIDPDESNSDQLIPIYTEIENITTAKIRNLIQLILQELPETAWIESLSTEILTEFSLAPLKQAFFEIHCPPLDVSRALMDFRSPAQRRFIFEEFFFFELLMAESHYNFKQLSQALVHQVDAQFWSQLKPKLPFELTGAQQRVLAEIFSDMQLAQPMNRLIQGDVGSGKTMVAFIAALLAHLNGHQVALMAPTEILAEQHYKNAMQFFKHYQIEVYLLTGSTTASERNELLLKMQQPQPFLLIGTHALIEDPVQFYSLSLVIIDEQHRFGVKQRAKLKQKGQDPHFLIMTATPIPRTLALTVYGDLDVSVIDELPKGRSPIMTKVSSEAKRSSLYQFIHEQLEQGRQAYFVYPLIEESEKIELKNATEEHQKLVTQFAKFKVGLLHGRMKPAEKEQVMQSFRNQEYHILVSTTVIEVGVDVANATIMVIEHAERFGLSQLHQLRGRVGRGSHKSYCVLMPGYALSEEGKYRLSVMESTTDGFKVSEADLELRGPGEFLGAKQSGDMGFILANLNRDADILVQARELAFKLIKQDPQLSAPNLTGLKNKFQAEKKKRGQYRTG